MQASLIALHSPIPSGNSCFNLLQHINCLLRPDHSYCNSVVQCLYFSEPFREQVINFPKRISRNSSGTIVSDLHPHTTDETSSADSASGIYSLPPPKFQVEGFGHRKNVTIPTSPVAQNNKPEESKDSFEYQKRQAIDKLPRLHMDKGNFEAYGMPESLFTGLKDIFEAVIAHESRVGVITLASFVESLRQNHEDFRSPVHQDAHEFLNLLLNEVVEQVKNFSKEAASSLEEASKTAQSLGPSSRISGSLGSPLPVTRHNNTQPNTSWVHELFEGTLTSETRCLTCENISQRDEAFLDLSVDLEEHSSVTSCLMKFSEEEMLCEQNKFHCDICGGLQEAEKRMKIKRLPRILSLHLKRFKYAEDFGRMQKLFHRVVYPFHLRLLNTTDDAEDADRLYELYAVIVHLGTTPFHGHYVSIIKTRDRGWLLFDDELVLPVDKSYVRNFFGGDPRNPACAYVLFYQETTIETVQREQEIEEPIDDGLRTTDLRASAGLNIAMNGELSPAFFATEPLQTPLMESEDSLAHLEHATTAPTPLASPLPAQLESINEEALAVKEAGGTFALMKNNSFSRFRNTSMSLRQKPKFWGSKDKSDLREAADTSTVEEDHGVKDMGKVQPEPLVDKPEKLRTNRFSLSRKKSIMHL